MDKERLFRYLDRKYSSKSEIIPNIPLGENADVIWEEILHSRRERSIELPLVNVNGDAYWYILTRKMISASEVIVEELLEQENTAEPHTSSVSTIEEIYYTGFMEGAQISVQDAMKFLQSGEEPESVEELILLNSRQAAGFAAENMYHAIDSNYLHNLAYFLTEGLDNGSGDFRMTDNIEIPSMQGESVQLPPAAMLPEQTERFADFLTTTGTHPLIKAAVAQAWVLAYRPFPEGNERLARLLSNVILIRAGYGFFGNISISSILAQTSYEYFLAIANILRVENGADLTYFLEYYLVTLSSAVNELKARKQHQAYTVIEAEQQMAAEPLSATQKVVS
ncbi:MAG: Fic family protein, partial [Oscillospiraceae bacterium]|nr:Fic family protein [Oscillospiraceae bacterium]